MNDQQSAMLKAALLEVGMNEVHYVRSLPAPSQPRSAEFEQNIRALCKQSRQWSPRIIKMPSRKWLTVLIAALLLFALSLSVSAIRKPIFSVFERITDCFAEIIFPSKQEKTPMQEYQVGWVPEKYKQHSHTSDNDMVKTTWTLNEKYVTFTQYSKGYHVHIDVEDVNMSNVTWANREINYYQKNGTYHVSWSENGYFLTLICPTDLPWEDIIRMIESIHPAE